jgi:hypothetical protein
MNTGKIVTDQVIVCIPGKPEHFLQLAGQIRKIYDKRVNCGKKTSPSPDAVGHDGFTFTHTGFD